MRKKKKSGSFISVIGALSANVAVAAVKFIAAYVTGSSAMLSEGIHSAVDTSNEILLLLGMRRSKLPPDKTHPFGYGREIYFWSLIVAVLIFGAGGGVSVYEGVSHILHPEMMKNPKWNYIVLGASLIFETTSLVIGVRHLPRRKRLGFRRAMKVNKDPSIFIVIYEDSAAILGILVAFLGVYLSQVFQSPLYDGLSSIFIGVILAVVAVMLIHECHRLIIGQSAEPEVTRGISEIVLKETNVEKVSPPLTSHLSAKEIFLAMDVQFKPDLKEGDVVMTVTKLEAAIQERYPHIRKIYIEARRLPGTT